MKISTDSIEGFAEMTPEDQVKALLGLDVPNPVDLSGYVKKDVFDAKASEAANLSKQLKSRMTEEEQAKAQQEAAQKELEDKYNALVRKSTIADHTARYLALGYEKDLAEKTAEALFDGDMNKVFENQSAFIANREAVIKAEAVKNMPAPQHQDPAQNKELYVPPLLI
jgi:hypothetical protein